MLKHSDFESKIDGMISELNRLTRFVDNAQNDFDIINSQIEEFS